ncbi:MAG: acetyl-CoA carboxylase, biotin carboxyl carrier protein [Nitrospiraceae bacterium]|jgi:acetyl-CoA carboxylase biotin carboxyl carrier protein|nr:acetyl-CoA carboxylase, biotin carboxyl carrier protein [Nitrospiraceae bacterium]|tara:strand:- start:177 stop:704 length:528 start_codon:yes stop_codon:yes gene_type:complete
MSSASGKRPSLRKKISTRQKKTGTSSTFDIFELEKLIDLFQRKDITELEVEQAGIRVKLGKQNESGTQRTQSSSPERPSPQKGRTPIDQTLSDPNLFPITSPLVGTFYRASSADAKPYVEEGDKVRKGQVLGLIEAMKLMNEVESEVDGTVVSILIENGTPVEYGEPLALIRPQG